MNRTCAIRCSCCGLDQNVSVALGEKQPVLSCARCTAHHDDTVESVLDREADHAAMYRHAILDAQDAASLAHGERDFYRDQLKDAYGEREVLIQALLQFDELHHYRGAQCACGVPGCRIVELLSNPRIARVIGTYDEHRHTMRELRKANPGVSTGEWDDVDVTLVYPHGEYRVGSGRHRTTA